MTERTTKPYDYKVLNIKLIIKEQTSTDKYIELFERLMNDSPKIYTGKDIFGKIISFAKHDFDRGVCYEGTVIKAKESEQTYEFDEDDKPIVVENNENHFTNPIISKFLFIPEAHRFAFIEESGANIKWFKSFISKFINQILQDNETIELSIKTSTQFIEDYLRDAPIRKIKIQMSYSNSDSFDDEAMAAMEENMKETHTRKLTVIAESDRMGNIDVLDNIILNPLAGIALDNGQIEVWDQENRSSRPSVTTRDVPENFTIETTEYGIVRDIYNRVINLFRNQNSQ